MDSPPSPVPRESLPDFNSDNPIQDTEFKIRFDGKLNEVNASTLGYSLVNMATLVSEATREVDTVATVEIKVKATAPGSFEVFLALQSTLDGIFQALGPEGVRQASSAALVIVKTVAGVFKIRKLLKGEPPKETIHQGDNFEIHGHDNATILVDRRTYNLYFNHPIVNDALTNIFKTLQSDQFVERFEMRDSQDAPLFDANREDFQQMALSTSIPQPEKREIVEDAWVHIIKPAFRRKLKWELLYKGSQITVFMKDERFLDRVEDGEQFAKGDTLFVALRIEQKLDKHLQTYVNKRYEVLEVKQHVPRVRLVQGTLELPPVSDEK